MRMGVAAVGWPRPRSRCAAGPGCGECIVCGRWVLPSFWQSVNPWESLGRHIGAEGILQIMIRGVTPRPKATVGASEADASRQFPQEFSEIELLVAIDVIRSAIAEHRKHLDREVLRSVLAKLTAALRPGKGPHPQAPGRHARGRESIR